MRVYYRGYARAVCHAVENTEVRTHGNV
jgi:hypothetical protein